MHYTRALQIMMLLLLTKNPKKAKIGAHYIELCRCLYSRLGHSSLTIIGAQSSSSSPSHHTLCGVNVTVAVQLMKLENESLIITWKLRDTGCAPFPHLLCYVREHDKCPNFLQATCYIFINFFMYNNRRARLALTQTWIPLL